MYPPPLIQNSAAHLILVLNFYRTTLHPVHHTGSLLQLITRSNCHLKVEVFTLIHSLPSSTPESPRGRSPLSALDNKQKKRNPCWALVLHWTRFYLFIYLDKTLQVLDDISLLLLRGLNALFVSCLEKKKKKKPRPNECNVMQHTFHHLFISHLPPIPLIFIWARRKMCEKMRGKWMHV